jgi:hypothetical protein
MTSKANARTIRAAQAEPTLAALRKQRNHQDALIAAYFAAVAGAEAAAAKVEQVRAAGVAAVARAQSAADAKVTTAQQDAAPTVNAVNAALVALADVIGETQTSDLLGVTTRKIKAARRSRSPTLSGGPRTTRDRRRRHRTMN